MSKKEVTDLIIKYDSLLYDYIAQRYPQMFNGWVKIIHDYEMYFAFARKKKFLQLLPTLSKAYNEKFSLQLNFNDEIEYLKQNLKSTESFPKGEELLILGKSALLKATEYVLIIMKTLTVDQSPLSEKFEYLLGSLSLAMFMLFTHDVCLPTDIMTDLTKIYFKEIKLNICINKVISKLDCVLPPVQIDINRLVREELNILKSKPSIEAAKEFISNLAPHWYSPLEEIKSKNRVQPDFVTALTLATTEIIEKYPSLHRQLQEATDVLLAYVKANPEDDDARRLEVIFKKNQDYLKRTGVFEEKTVIFKPDFKKHPPRTPIRPKIGKPCQDDDEEGIVYSIRPLPDAQTVKEKSPLEAGIFGTSSNSQCTESVVICCLIL